jgi:hypothetical protein
MFIKFSLVAHIILLGWDIRYNLNFKTRIIFSVVFEMWDFKFSRRRVWCSELSSGLNIIHPWWWRQYVPLKRRSTIILHGSTTQKTALNVFEIFIKLHVPHNYNRPLVSLLLCTLTCGRTLWCTPAIIYVARNASETRKWKVIQLHVWQ